MLGGRPKLPPVSTALDSQRDRAVRKVRETLSLHSFIRALQSYCGQTISWKAGTGRKSDLTCKYHEISCLYSCAFHM